MRKGTQGDYSMKYFSEELNRLFDNEKECQEAEFKAREEKNRERMRIEHEERLKKERQDKLAAERKAKAAEVEEARKTMVAAQHKYKELLEAFCKTYGSFHLSLTDEDAKRAIPTLFDFFNLF